MYNVLDIACFVINTHNKLYPEKGITNLRLQEILYFIQCKFLVENNKECFKEKIIAWPYGTVVVEVYEEFKKYGKSNIPNIDYYGKFFTREKFDDRLIKKRDKKLISSILLLLNTYSNYELLEIIHNQDPWINARRNGNNTEITQLDIKKYFLENI